MAKKMPAGGEAEAEAIVAAEELHANAGEMAKGTIFGLAGTFFFKLVSFIYTIYVAHVISQGDIGLFNLAFGIISLLTIWKDFGLSSTLTRYVPFFEGAGEHGKTKELATIVIVSNIAMGLILTAVFWFGADWIGNAYAYPGLAEAIRLLAAVILFDNIARACSGYLQGRMDIKAVQLIANTQNVARLTFTIACVQIFGATLFSISIGYVLSALASAIIGLPLMWDSYRRLPGAMRISSKELILEIAPFGMMLTALTAFTTLITYVDKILIGYMMPRDVAGANIAIYSYATVLALNIMVFPGAVGSIFLPLISKMLGKGNYDAARGIMASAQRWVLLLTLPFAIVMLAYSSEMLSSFYGADYSMGGNAMRLFLFGLVLNIFTYTFAIALAAMRQIRLELLIAIAAGVANVILNIALIPIIGIDGAALSAVASFGISSLLYVHYCKKLLKFGMPSGTYRLAAAALATFAIIWVSKPAAAFAYALLPNIPFIGGFEAYFAKFAYLALLGIVTALAFAIFTAICLLLKCFGHEDAAVMKKIAMRMNIPKKIITLAEKTVTYGIAKK